MQTHHLAAATVVCAAVATGSLYGQRTAESSIATDLGAIATTRLTTGLNMPVGLTHAPGDTSRLFVIEKLGRIRIINLPGGGLLSLPFLDISGIVNTTNQLNDERGMLGIAFHPDYDTNGYFYVHYTGSGGHSRVARYQVSSNPNVADPNSALVLLQINQPDWNHNGGWMGFGPDGYLYIAVGDGGGAGDPGNNGQNKQSLLGTMLRIDVDNTDPGLNYAIPNDNPFVGDPSGLDQIWAYGLRNPWRNSFDRLTGDLYIADVGQNQWEEINFQPANSEGGENYGWRCYEGNKPFNLTGCGSPSNMEFPFHVYPISGSPNCAIIGGYVYRGSSIPSLYGYYFFGDFCAANIWAVERDSVTTSEPILLTSQLSPSIEGHSIAWISSFGEDANGEIYILSQTFFSGSVFKIIFQGPENDACSTALAVGTGGTQFDNTGASTAGPDEPDSCNFLGDTNLQRDVWFVHEAACTGQMAVSVCDADFTTKLAIYQGDCPSESGEVIACDLDSCSAGSGPAVTLNVTAGETYYIRVGGHDGETGAGVLNIECEAADCIGDLTGNNSVGLPDLLLLINNWGTCPQGEPCPADLTGSGSVGLQDLLLLIEHWGACP